MIDLGVIFHDLPQGTTSLVEGPTRSFNTVCVSRVRKLRSSFFGGTVLGCGEMVAGKTTIAHPPFHLDYTYSTRIMYHNDNMSDIDEVALAAGCEIAVPL